MDVKQAYQDKADAQLCEWRNWIERFKSEHEAASHEEQNRKVARLDDCFKIASDRLKELCASPESRWELAKQALERAMIDLKMALDDSGAVRAGRFLRIEASRSHAYEPFQRRG